jgi:AcrR family transcriptional regulator
VSMVTPSRRERLRAATVDEIMVVARRLLVADGPAAISLRAIARDMGMTAPALYRYFPSLEELVQTLCATLYDELSDHLEHARDTCPADDITARLYALCRAFRRWSVAHPAEFGLMFGSPLPGLANPVDPVEKRNPDSPTHVAGARFAGVFGALFAEVWARAPFEVPPAEEIPPALRTQLDGYVRELGVGLPVGAIQLFLSCWIRLYGMVALEVFGHLYFALTDPEPMFEAELAVAACQIGLAPRPLPPAA